MNIVFEGIDASGKTTIIKSVIKKLKLENISVNYIKEIEESPLSGVLSDMLKMDPFFNSRKRFKTSIYETFVLAAEHFYKQEYYREFENYINIFDRDFLTILCYQKFILEAEYGQKYKSFFQSFQECILFDLKDIDLLIYVKVPLEVSVRRIENRDKYILCDKEIKFLENVKKYFEDTLLQVVRDFGIKIIELNGEEDEELNLEKIVKQIRRI